MYCGHMFGQEPAGIAAALTAALDHLRPSAGFGSLAAGSDLVPFNLDTGNSDFDIGVLIDAPGTGAVPEPATISLLALGIGSMLVRRQRNQKKLNVKRSALPSASTLRDLN